MEAFPSVPGTAKRQEAGVHERPSPERGERRPGRARESPGPRPDPSGGRPEMAAMTALGAAGVPAGALRSTTEVLADADLRQRGIFVTVDDPGRGKVTIPA